MQRRASPQDNHSLELHQNTLIQVYNNLDSSEDFQDDSSSNQQPLSESHLKKLDDLKEEEGVRQGQLDQRGRGSGHAPPRRPVKPIRDIENKYDLEVSSSTREDTSLNRFSNEQQRKSNPIHLYTGSHLPDIESDSHEQNDYSEEYGSISEEKSSQRSEDSGRQARLGQKRKKVDFNIDSFLNAEPIHVKPKKGAEVLNRAKNNVLIERPRRQKYNVTPSRLVEEEDTIHLITLPEVDLSRAKRVAAVVSRNEEELQGMRADYGQRLDSARLTFLDNFLPQPLRIKSNPYNLLKYINSRVRI